MAEYTHLNREHVTAITAEYPFRVREFRPFARGWNNTSLLLETDRGEYVLTLFEDKPFDEVRQLGLLLQGLIGSRFPTTIPADDVSARLVTQFHGKPVLIKHFVPGRVHELLSAPMLAETGRTMAILHDLPAPPWLPRQHPYGLAHFDTLPDEEGDPAFRRWLAGRLAYLRRSMPPDLPRGLIHGDVFFDNLIFLDGELRAVLDFEEACEYFRVFDLGMAMIGVCAPDHRLDLNKARALLSGYQSRRKLTGPETDALQLFTAYAAVATAYWRYRRFYVQTPMPEHQGRTWQMVELADQVAAIPAATFLERVMDR